MGWDGMGVDASSYGAIYTNRYNFGRVWYIYMSLVFCFFVFWSLSLSPE